MREQKTDRLNIRIESSLLDALREEAKKEGGTYASLITRTLRTMLVSRGWELLDNGGIAPKRDSQ